MDRIDVSPAGKGGGQRADEAFFDIKAFPFGKKDAGNGPAVSRIDADDAGLSKAALTKAGKIGLFEEDLVARALHVAALPTLSGVKGCCRRAMPASMALESDSPRRPLSWKATVSTVPPASKTAMESFGTGPRTVLMMPVSGLMTAKPRQKNAVGRLDRSGQAANLLFT